MKPLTEAHTNSANKVYYPNLRKQADRYGYLHLAIVPGTYLFSCFIWYAIDPRFESYDLGIFLTLNLVLCGGAVGLARSVVPWHLGFLCPHCGKHLTTKATWICGYCDHQHSTPWYAWDHACVGSCKKCEQKVAAFACHHCGYRICLDDKADDRNPAYHKHLLPAAVGIERPAIEPSEARQQDELKRLEREKQRIEYETQVMQARIALATVEGRLAEVNGKRENPFGQAIKNMLDPLKTANERREALLIYERSTRQSVLGRADLSDEEKRKLIDDLAIDIEQARVGEA